MDDSFQPRGREGRPGKRADYPLMEGAGVDDACRHCDLAAGQLCVDPATCPQNRTHREMQHHAEMATGPAGVSDLAKAGQGRRVLKGIDKARVAAVVTDLLRALNHDPNSPGLADTPRRVADMWAEFLDYEPGNLGTTFEAVHTDQLVVVGGMRVWSMCEHHLLPFWCDVTIGYLARDKVLGLSKVGRLAHKHAHQLQLQERLVHGIATELQDMVGHEDVAVIAGGEHLCMTMRGIRTPHRMISSAMLGAFRDGALRAEFLQLAKAHP